MIKQAKLSSSSKAVATGSGNLVIMCAFLQYASKPSCPKKELNLLIMKLSFDNRVLMEFKNKVLFGHLRNLVCTHVGWWPHGDSGA